MKFLVEYKLQHFEELCFEKGARNFSTFARFQGMDHGGHDPTPKTFRVKSKNHLNIDNSRNFHWKFRIIIILPRMICSNFKVMIIGSYKAIKTFLGMLSISPLFIFGWKDYFQFIYIRTPFCEWKWLLLCIIF